MEAVINHLHFVHLTSSSEAFSGEERILRGPFQPHQFHDYNSSLQIQETVPCLYRSTLLCITRWCSAFEGVTSQFLI